MGIDVTMLTGDNSRTANAIARRLTVSSLVTLFFFLLAIEKGYGWMDVIVGSIWTFVLATIISSPILIPVIRKKLRHSKSKHAYFN